MLSGQPDIREGTLEAGDREQHFLSSLGHSKDIGTSF
jgi:hypothetical protein